jgi:hypothetical protein
MSCLECLVIVFARDEIANSDLRHDMNESEINTNAVFFLFFEKFFQQKKKHWNFRVGRKKKIFEVRYE